MDKEKLFSVGELARRCGVTIRTLQFYAKKGVLSPRHFTEGGRRLYEREDIIKLQQILFLKSFGFSLDEIKEKLLVVETPGQLGDILIKQQEILKSQITNIQNIVDFMEKVIHETIGGSYVNTEKLVMLMEMMKAGSHYTFVLRYFDNQQTKDLLDKLEGDGQQNGISIEWAAISNELIDMYQRRVLPESDEGQDLVDRWWKMVQKFTGGDPEKINSLFTIGKDVDNWPDDVSELRLAVKDFLAKGFEKYFEKQKNQVDTIPDTSHQ